MPIYNEDIVPKWVEELSSITQPELCDFYYEFQDGFNDLLITANLTKTPDRAVLDDIGRKIEDYLYKKTAENRRTLSWVVNIYYRNELIESYVEGIP